MMPITLQVREDILNRSGNPTHAEPDRSLRGGMQDVRRMMMAGSETADNPRTTAYCKKHETMPRKPDALQKRPILFIPPKAASDGDCGEVPAEGYDLWPRDNLHAIDQPSDDTSRGSRNALILPPPGWNGDAMTVRPPMY